MIYFVESKNVVLQSIIFFLTSSMLFMKNNSNVMLVALFSINLKYINLLLQFFFQNDQNL